MFYAALGARPGTRTGFPAANDLEMFGGPDSVDSVSALSFLREAYTSCLLDSMTVNFYMMSRVLSTNTLFGKIVAHGKSRLTTA